MAKKDDAETRRIRIYPTGDGYIPGVPAVQMLLDPDEAALLLAFRPPVFTTQRPDGVELEESPRETLDDLHLPWVPVDTAPAPDESPPDAGVAAVTSPGE